MTISSWIGVGPNKDRIAAFSSEGAAALGAVDAVGAVAGGATRFGHVIAQMLQHFQHILDIADERGTFADQPVAAACAPVNRVAGHRHHFAPLFQRVFLP